MKKTIFAAGGMFAALILGLSFLYFKNKSYLNEANLQTKLKEYLEGSFKGINSTIDKVSINQRSIFVEGINLRYKGQDLLFIDKLRTKINLKSFFFFHTISPIEIRNLRVNWDNLNDYYESGWNPDIEDVKVLGFFNRIIWSLKIEQTLIFNSSLESSVADCSNLELFNIHHDELVNGEFECDWATSKYQGKINSEIEIDLAKANSYKRAAIQLKWENKIDKLGSTDNFLHEGQSRIRLEQDSLGFDSQINSTKSQLQFSVDLSENQWKLNEMLGEIDFQDLELFAPDFKESFVNFNIEDVSKVGVDLEGSLDLEAKKSSFVGEIKALNPIVRELNYRDEKISSLWRLEEGSINELTQFTYKSGEIKVRKEFQLDFFSEEEVIKKEMGVFVSQVDFIPNDFDFIFNLLFPHFQASTFERLTVEGSGNKYYENALSFKLKSSDEERSQLEGSFNLNDSKLTYSYENGSHQFKTEKIKAEKIKELKLPYDFDFTGEILIRNKEVKFIPFPYVLEGSDA